MNTSGFTFRPLCEILKDGIPGLQYGFQNNYSVIIVPDSYSKDKRFKNATVSVAILKSVDFEHTEDKTIDIMEKMGHEPTIQDMQANILTGVTPEYLLKILYIVSRMDVQ